MDSKNNQVADEEKNPQEANSTPVDGHQALIDELRDYRAQMALGGGEARIKAQHAKGKLTARERVLRLLDEGTFVEIEGFMMHRQTEFGLDQEHFLGDGIVSGFGKINGRMICIYSQDFTVLGGSFSEVAGQKLSRLLDKAIQAGVPIVGINDGGGARIQEGVYSLGAFGELFYRNSIASGVVPQISIQLGPCAGGAVYSPGLMDFIIMAKGLGNMYITGPEVIKTVTGEEVDMETLGGAMTHSSVSGVCHFVSEDENDALAMTRTLLSYLPANNTEPAPASQPTDDPWRMDAELNSIIPLETTTAYDMKEVIAHIFDRDTFMEVHANFAQNAIVGFARLHGQVVGIVGQQPLVLSGAIDINAADKMARFIRFCDAFNIPLITFMDSPGFLPGVTQEHGGIIRHGAKIVYSYSEATVPKITIITRKGYGGAMVVMGSKNIHTDLVFAWPSAEIAVMGAEGAVSILYRKELKAMENPQAERARLVGEYRDRFSKPYRTAGAGFVDDIIIPAETRPRLIAALELLRDKQTSLPPKKHGCMPL